MKFPFRRRAGSRGLTLVELLVVFLIIATLAVLVFTGFRRYSESARSAINLANLRNVGTIITSISQDKGYFPAGWNFGSKESWADLVIREIHGEDGFRQDKLLLSPLVAREIPGDLNQTAISNYSVSPFIFPQGSVENGYQAYRVTPAQLRRPNQQILLGDALPRAAKAPYGFSMIVWWGLRTTTGNAGVPPVSPENRGSTQVNLPAKITEMTDDGGVGLPAFRNRSQGHFLFADGHVEALRPEELQFKHFAISY